MYGCINIRKTEVKWPTKRKNNNKEQKKRPMPESEVWYIPRVH
jgi:hypothetical protein